MSTIIQKLRIYAMLMRCQEIQQSKISKIKLIGGGRCAGKVLAIGMDFGPVTLTEKAILENKPFKLFDIPDYDVILKDDTPSKFFSKPKNNYKR